MARCVAIYPEAVSDTYIRRMRDYIVMAKRYGFDEIFTSLHIPEHSLSEQLDPFVILAEECRKSGLDLTADVGGKYIDMMLNNEDLLMKLKEIPFAFIRLDYGFDIIQVRRLYRELDIRGFVINASIYSREEADALIEELRSIDDRIELRACHNFYVREESGLDGVFAYRQSEIFARHGIPVYYCIASHSNPRGPLHKGLCTIEGHRYESLREVLSDLTVNYGMEAFMMGDRWLSEEEFREIKETMDVLKEELPNTVIIPVVFSTQASYQEKRTVLREHRFRYDSPSRNLRSQTSRQMAEFAAVFSRNNTIERKCGSITIDNEAYMRYSGELQVIMGDMPADERVNVVARVKDLDDLVRLARFREGIGYIFTEEES